MEVDGLLARVEKLERERIAGLSGRRRPLF